MHGPFDFHLTAPDHCKDDPEVKAWLAECERIMKEDPEVKRLLTDGAVIHSFPSASTQEHHS